MQGYIIQKIDKQALPDGTIKELCTNQEYHPFLFAQHQNSPSKVYESFNEAVDEFYSNLESQKYDVKCMQQVSIYRRYLYINMYYLLYMKLTKIL